MRTKVCDVTNSHWNIYKPIVSNQPYQYSIFKTSFSKHSFQNSLSKSAFSKPPFQKILWIWISILVCEYISMWVCDITHFCPHMFLKPIFQCEFVTLHSSVLLCFSSLYFNVSLWHHTPLCSNVSNVYNSI